MLWRRTALRFEWRCMTRTKEKTTWTQTRRPTRSITARGRASVFECLPSIRARLICYITLHLFFLLRHLFKVFVCRNPPHNTTCHHFLKPPTRVRIRNFFYYTLSCMYATYLTTLLYIYTQPHNPSRRRRTLKGKKNPTLVSPFHPLLSYPLPPSPLCVCSV